MEFKNKYIVLLYFVIAPLLTNAQSTPVMYFPFNGNSQDETGNGNNATNYGATLTTDRFGNTNSAYLFDGIDDYMEIMPVSDLSAVGDYTICLWMIHYDWSGVGVNNIERQYVFDGHSNSNNALETDILRTGSVIIFDQSLINFQENFTLADVYVYSPINYFEAKNSPSIFSNSWQFITFQRIDDIYKFYINGNLISITKTATASLPSNALIDMDHSLYIGTFAGNNPNYYFNGYNFSGKIDDFRYFTNALNEQEILKLYYENNYTAISISGTTQNVSRIGATDGAINVVINGGILPYSFQWSNDSITQNISNLIPGFYTLTVTDALGYEYFETFEVLQNYPPDTLSISGFVTANSNFITNSRIVLFKIDNQIPIQIDEVFSDINGNFIFNDLFPANYIVMAYPNTDINTDFSATYYFETTEIQSVEIIELQGHISHININLLSNIDKIENRKFNNFY